jgi:cell division protein FtsZ
MIAKKTIGIFGVGSSGCRALNEYDGYSETEQIVAVDVDHVVLQSLDMVPSVLLLGGEEQGLGGVAGNVALAEEIITSEDHMIEGLLSKVDMVVLVAGFAGSTAAGMLPFIVKKANALAIPTVVVGTTPFYFEGEDKKETSKNVLATLEKLSCSVIQLNLSHLAKEDDELATVCLRATECLSESLKFLVGLISYPGFIRIDYQALKNMIKSPEGDVWFSYGKSVGPNRAENVVVDFKANQLTNLKNFANARTALVSINSDESLRLVEIETIMESVKNFLDPTCKVVMGTTNNKILDGEIVLNVLAFEFRVEEETIDINLIDLPKPQNNIAGGDNKKSLSPTEVTPAMKDSKFKGADPTIYNGINLDVPTYKRNGIVLN